MRRVARCAAVVAVIAVPLVAVSDPAVALGTKVADVVITFENDSVGAKANGFVSADSTEVSFQDTNGANLSIGNFGSQGEGARSLIVGTDFDDSGVRILLSRPTNRLSLRFGNDDPFYSEPGDEAVLTVYRGTGVVGERRVTMNRNDIMDQTIAFADGPLFNRAILKYDVTPSVGVQEVIDRVTVGPLCTIAGTEFSETLRGTSGNDVICGGGGNDTIDGAGGNDHISGGGGADTIDGGSGDDYVTGDLGNDTIYGGLGADFVWGADGNDNVNGDAGNDAVHGGAGTDKCNGGTGTDTSSGCESKTGIP